MTRLQPAPAQSLRAAAYIRVSEVGARGDDLMSPDLQLAAARSWCERHGAELVEVVEDIDQSGRNWKPRKIGGLVDRVAAGELDVIVVWKWSRFARNRVDWAVHVDRVESAGGQLASATEDVDTSTSAGRFARGMLAELAAFESERIGEGWRETHRARFEAGLPPGWYPYGWRRAGRGIEPDPATSPVVAELYRRKSAGAGFQSLAHWANDQGIPSPTGRLWTTSSLIRLMDNPTHAGFVRLNGETRPGQHDGIITAEQWGQYQADRRMFAREHRRISSQFLLSGLVVCGACGYRMTGWKGNPKRGLPQYRCQHAMTTNAHPHRIVSVRKVETPVMAWLADRAEGIDNAAQRAPVAPTLVPDMDALAGQIGAADRKLAALLLRELDGTPAAALEIARAGLLERRATLLEQLEAERDRRAIASPEPQAAAVRLLDDWDLLALDAKRAALRALIRRVVVHLGPDFDVVVEPMEPVP